MTLEMTPNLRLMEITPGGIQAWVNQWDVANRLLDGWTLVVFE